MTETGIRPSLLDMTAAELEQTLQDMGEKRFRAKQIGRWLVRHAPFAEMTDLSESLRRRLEERFREGYLELVTMQESLDGSRKYLFRTHDGCLIESVRMTYDYGNTVCVSTQAGCAMGCAFCASAQGGLIRSLTAGEILAQVLAVNADGGEGRSIRNIVLMGTGEPLANYDGTVSFLRRVSSADSLGVSPRNISISTCGLVPQIYKLADEGLPVTLSISLHAAWDGKRRELMPVAGRYTVEETVSAARHYAQRTGRRVTYEYMLIAGFNDTAGDIAALAKLAAGAHVNVIAYNSAAGDFKAPAPEAVRRFVEALEKRGVQATRRRSLGSDIDGACGQLRAKHSAKDS